jgi:mono/diheme cytochrome c family protein
MAKDRAPYVLEAVAMLLVLGVVAVGTTVGFIVGRDSKASSSATVTTALAGHSGAGLPPHEFGDPAVGAKLFVSKGCADCHSYGGQGGTDGPPLDYMAGHLSAREVADMSGQIWNHLPVMLQHFKDEGIPVPTFQADQMADLVSYLHSESPGSAGATTSGGTQMGDTTSSP